MYLYMSVCLLTLTIRNLQEVLLQATKAHIVEHVVYHTPNIASMLF